MLSLACLIMATGLNPVTASDEKQQSLNSTDSAIFARVNDEPVAQDLYDFLLASREEQSDDGSTATGNAPRAQPDLRGQVSRDLIMTVLLAQKAKAGDADKSAQFKLELELFSQTLLAQIAVQEIMAGIEVEEAQIRKRYAQQPPQTLYRFMIWETSSKKLAANTLDLLRAGDQALEQNPLITRIETPWLMGTDIDPEVNRQVMELNIEQFVGSPIHQDEKWKVVQLIDKRELTRESYAQERDNIRADIVAEELQKKLDSLFAAAEIISDQ